VEAKLLKQHNHENYGSSVPFSCLQNARIGGKRDNS
jgi:hypothetical protein